MATPNSPAAGIIPARAGFTSSTSGATRRGPDHPRSRGVYGPMTPIRPGRPGSSPLARGLRAADGRARGGEGIIPARAGFTDDHRRPRRGARDHPRSRGVYPRSHAGPQCHWGSSPLARGLPPGSPDSRRSARIIPARAGFTPPATAATGARGDHPRSRGVYAAVSESMTTALGSSPLARGLREDRRGPEHGYGIIPARAGFTSRTSDSRSPVRDHPRSRGVYTCGSLESQRTRTLPDPCCLHCRPRARSAELR